MDRVNGSVLGEPFSASVSSAGNGARLIVLSGEIDLAVVDELRLLLAADGNVVVDLSAVTFIDSSGIAALLAAHRRQQTSGHSLWVQGAHGPVSRVLEITGTDTVLRPAWERDYALPPSTS